MEILLIFLGILAVIAIIVMIKYYSDPKMRKAVDTLVEYHEKEEQRKNSLNYDKAYKFVKDNPDDGSDEWLDKASEIILENDNYDNEDFITNDDLENIILDLNEYADFGDRIEIPIRGINFRNLTNANIGTFDGFIMPDKENRHDKYAIGVYDNDGTHFGFIEKGQKYFYKKIESVGGFISSELDISTFIDNTGKSRFSGTVTINKKDLV
jgi:hypothetical protein